jgi:hypothetical protein
MGLAVILPSMPTILLILGWRFFSYAHSYSMSPADKRTVRSIIYQHFDYIVSEWNSFQEQKNG